MAKKKDHRAAENPVPAERQEPGAAPADVKPAAQASPALSMRVRMRTKAAGPGIYLVPGKVYELPAEFASALIAGGYAIEVAVDSERETR